jgi:hypothetical protein
MHDDDAPFWNLSSSNGWQAHSLLRQIAQSPAIPFRSCEDGCRYSSSASRAALPPDASLFTLTTCSSAKRCMRLS